VLKLGLLLVDLLDAAALPTTTSLVATSRALAQGGLGHGGGGGGSFAGAAGRFLGLFLCCCGCVRGGEGDGGEDERRRTCGVSPWAVRRRQGTHAWQTQSTRVTALSPTCRRREAEHGRHALVK
jgi:hypothetical protein